LEEIAGKHREATGQIKELRDLSQMLKDLASKIDKNVATLEVEKGQIVKAK